MKSFKIWRFEEKEAYTQGRARGLACVLSLVAVSLLRGKGTRKPQVVEGKEDEKNRCFSAAAAAAAAAADHDHGDVPA